jgi:hypothetical protein
MIEVFGFHAARKSGKVQLEISRQWHVSFGCKVQKRAVCKSKTDELIPTCGNLAFDEMFLDLRSSDERAKALINPRAGRVRDASDKIWSFG